jgi:hypothetical protein
MALQMLPAQPADARARVERLKGTLVYGTVALRQTQEFMNASHQALREAHDRITESQARAEQLAALRAALRTRRSRRACAEE